MGDKPRLPQAPSFVSDKPVLHLPLSSVLPSDLESMVMVMVMVMAAMI